MTNHIIPKIAFLPLEYRLSVDAFVGLWNELEVVGEPTQKDYDEWVLDSAQAYFYDMRNDIQDSIRLIEDN
jgi:hypothetical protein